MEQQQLPQEQASEETWSQPRLEAIELTALEESSATLEESVTPTETELVSQARRVLRRDTRQRIVLTLLMPIVPFAAMLPLKSLIGEDAWIGLLSNPAFVAISTLLIGVGVPLALLKPSRKVREACRSLSKIEDVGAIGGLVESLYLSSYGEVGNATREAMIRLLEKLKASDAGLLAEGHLKLLRHTLVTPSYTTCDLLTSPKNRRKAHARVQIAILKAFEQVGDSKALSAVTYLAKSATDQEVKEAANACLPCIQARVEASRASQFLLRASSVSEADPGTLLRAVEENHLQPPNEMVRPSNAPQPDHVTDTDVSDSSAFHNLSLVLAASIPGR